MEVEVLDERRIQVRPGRPTGCDIVEYVHALLEAEGWKQVADPAAPGETVVAGGPWTLHDAIGEANRRLFRPQHLPGSGKEGVQTDQGETTRVEATRLIERYLPQGMDDQSFNDQAQSVDEVLEQALAGCRS